MTAISTPSGSSRWFLPLLGAVALGATGCASSEIWLLKLAAPSSDACADPVITHNFINASAPDTSLSSDWNEGYRYAETSSLVYAQLTTTTSKAGVLLIGDRAFEGTREGKDWTFEWSGETGEADWQDHYSGYGYAEYYDTDEDVKITLSLDGNTGSGAWKSSGMSTFTWKETDTWNEDGAAAVGWEGAIPASTYLQVPDGTGEVEPASNAGDLVDCDNPDSPNVCVIASTVQCEDNRKLTATKTDYSDESAYTHLAGSGNSPEDLSGGSSLGGSASVDE